MTLASQRQNALASTSISAGQKDPQKTALYPSAPVTAGFFLEEPAAYALSNRAWDKQSIPQCTAPGGSNEQSITRQSLQPSSLYGQFATMTRASHCRCEQNTFWG